MVTVRQLLELMDEGDLVVITDDRTDRDEYEGNVGFCLLQTPNAVLDKHCVGIYSRFKDGAIVIKKESE